MTKMENQLQRNYKLLLSIWIILSIGLVSQAQSCVCYQNHLLNDYKEADFVAHITITSVTNNQRLINEDIAQFTTNSVFKGSEHNTLLIYQNVGNSDDNSKCRLFVKPGDELVIFASLVDGELITTPCKRNSFIYKNDSKFEIENSNLLGTLRALSEFNDQIETSSINCTSLQEDTDVIKEIGKLKIEEEEAYFGLYNVQFNEDNSIQYIGVVSPFNKEIDKKIRIMLIKKKWEPCELNDNRELLVAYFYYPSSSYRKSYLSTY